MDVREFIVGRLSGGTSCKNRVYNGLAPEGVESPFIEFEMGDSERLPLGMQWCYPRVSVRGDTQSYEEVQETVGCVIGLLDGMPRFMYVGKEEVIDEFMCTETLLFKVLTDKNFDYYGK